MDPNARYSVLFIATPMPDPKPLVFRCTPGGAIAAGRRRIGRILLGATFLMLALAIVVLVVGRWGPALICGGAAALAYLAWRMSGDLDPLWLTLTPGELMVQMRRQRASLALVSVAARRHDIVAMPVVDPGEEQLPDVGLITFEDAETGEQIEINTSSGNLRNRFAAAEARRRDELDRHLLGRGVDVISLATDEDYLIPLRAFFERRERRLAA